VRLGGDRLGISGNWIRRSRSSGRGVGRRFRRRLSRLVFLSHEQLYAKRFDFFAQLIDIFGRVSGERRIAFGCGGLLSVKVVRKVQFRSVIRIGRKADLPEIRAVLGELQFDIAGLLLNVAATQDLANHFMIGFLIGEEKQLAGRNGSHQTNDGAIFEN